MAKHVQLYRLSAASLADYAGPLGELVVDLTELVLTLHDGVTLGGIPLARADMSNIAVVSEDNNGIMTAAQYTTLLASYDAIAALQTSVAALGGALSAPSGTRMLFQQTAAPTGWTKDTSHNNKALRLVSGSVSSGGATAFTSVFGSGKSTGSHTLTAADIPAHSHTGTTGFVSNDHSHSGTTDAVGDHSHGIPYGTVSSGISADVNDVNAATSVTRSTNAAGAHSHTFTTGGVSANHTHDFTTSSVGSGGGHSHTLSLDLQYVDVIIAQKD